MRGQGAVMILFCLGALAAPASGNYALAEPDSVVKARVDAAITALLSPYPTAVRSLAAPRLAARATWCGSYTLTSSASEFLVSCDGDPPVPGVYGAPGSPWTSKKGDVVKLTTTAVGDAVEIRFEGDSGYQLVRYAPAESGLSITKTLHSNQLGLDFSWSMLYQRAP